MARYCVVMQRAPPRTRPLVVVHDAEAPPEEAERWTFGELDDAVRGSARACLPARPGQAQPHPPDNTSDYPLVFFGAIAAGLVPIPTSSQLTRDEVAFPLADSDA